MATTETAPKFTFWMGDGWPGVFVVETKGANGDTLVLATVHADGVEDALEKVRQAIPTLPPATELTIRNAYEITTDGMVVPEWPSLPIRD